MTKCEKEKDEKKLEFLELLNDENQKREMNKGVTKDWRIKTKNYFRARKTQMKNQANKLEIESE